MRISDWSSDVCSSDLLAIQSLAGAATEGGIAARSDRFAGKAGRQEGAVPRMAVVDRATEIQPRHPARREIGRASCRERVCQYVSISGVAVYIKKKKQQRT